MGDQLDLFETLDVDGGGTIDLEELIIGISKLRGEARRSDVVGVKLIARSIQSVLTNVLKLVEDLRDEQRKMHHLQRRNTNLLAKGTSHRTIPFSKTQLLSSSHDFAAPSAGQASLSCDGDENACLLNQENIFHGIEGAKF